MELDFAPLKEHTANYVKQVLAAVEGNKTAAARILRVSRRSIYRWLRVSQ